MHILQEIIQANKAGYHAGIYSCCSANEDVIRAVLLRACKTRTVALIESTSNQVNQMGGYTGMTPKDFAQLVYRLANEVGLASENVILGGDHLGPLPWADLPEKEAMAHAEELVTACVMAGYKKIHLDTSMRLASDNPDKLFLTKTCAERGACLCAICERAFEQYVSIHPGAQPLIYIIGSEVPVPGGDFNVGKMGVTEAADAINTIDIYRKAFEEYGVADAFERVVGLVVEMGIEFHEYTIDEYDRFKTAELVKAMRTSPLCIEGHSTDYQTTKNLSHMSEDGVAILKVGPALTFSLREAMFALEQIERELYYEKPEVLSNYREVLEKAMLENPDSWRSYYGGTKNKQRIARAYSFYDRSRYYLNQPDVMVARETLLENLSGNKIPLCVLSQYLPHQYLRVRQGQIRNEPLDILLDRIGDCVDSYLQATNNCGRSIDITFDTQ